MNRTKKGTDLIGCDDGFLYFRVRERSRKYRQERAIQCETKDYGIGQVGGEQGNSAVEGRNVDMSPLLEAKLKESKMVESSREKDLEKYRAV